MSHKFNVCLNSEDRFMNCDSINPIQQKRVLQLINLITKTNEVKKIIIFGSSVTQRCRIDSDVDIYVELTEKKKTITEYLDFVYDYWTNYDVDERLFKEIVETGVVVYEK